MKILHICMACTYTEGYNYQENYFSKYHAKEYDTYLMTNSYMFQKGTVVKSAETGYVNKDGVKVYRLEDKFSSLPKKINAYLGVYKGFGETLCQIEPDIIFVHNCQFNDIRKVARYAKEHPETKVYVDNHADFSNSATNPISKLIHKTLWRNCAHAIEPYAIRFFGVLPARVDFLKNVYQLPEEKCELLVMGADDDSVVRANEEAGLQVRKKHNIQSDDFLIVTGGKIDLFKTQTLELMQAVKQIENNTLKLIVFGSVVDELKEQFNSLVDGEKIQYVPWLSSEESYDYFAAAQLAVFPGRHSVYWEQVAGQGIPMLCKYWDGTTHVDCGGNVKFLKTDSVEELCHEIQYLLDKPEEYRRMKQVAVEKGMQLFSYKMISKKAIGK